MPAASLKLVFSGSRLLELLEPRVWCACGSSFLGLGFRMVPSSGSVFRVWALGLRIAGLRAAGVWGFRIAVFMDGSHSRCASVGIRLGLI